MSNIVIQELEPCKLKVSYEADAEQILNKRGEVLNLFKQAPVKGFRKGKATMQAIKQHYKTQIEESLKRALAEDAYHDTIFEKKLRPHGAPRINSALLSDGKFSCEFELYTKPDFELAPFKGVEVVKPHQSQKLNELTEGLLQDLRVRFGEMTPYTEEDFVQEGDAVGMDYEGFVDGEKVDVLSAQGEMMDIGKGRLPEFDTQLTGMKIGEMREFDLLVPDAGLPSLVGKKVHFKVNLTMGSKIRPCALDDELAVKLGKTNMQETREWVQGLAQGQLTRSDQAALNEAVSNKLVNDNNSFDVPQWITISEAKYLAHQSKLDWDKMPNEDKEKYLSMAEKNSRLSLILDKIREEEPEAQLSETEIFEMIKNKLATSAAKNGNSPDDLIKELNRTGQLQIIMARVKDEAALSHAVKSMKIIEN